MKPIVFRRAHLRDVKSLLHVENSCFDSDRMSEASFRHFIQKGKGFVLVALVEQQIAGYALVFLRENSLRARLYSIAILAKYRGLSLGSQLLNKAEKTAKRLGKVQMRLEVKQSNTKALNLYLDRGYQEYKRKPHYYMDGATAICLTKSL